MKKTLVLLGMMAVGKTTLAKITSKRKNLKFIDTDFNIVKKNSMTISEIFKKKGENFFRKEEEKEVLNALKKSNSVIAVGGGSFINKTVRENILKNAISVWLDADIEILDSRIKKNYKRPLLKKKNNLLKLKKIYDDRKKIYALADHKIECGKLNTQEIVKKIIEIYEKY